MPSLGKQSSPDAVTVHVVVQILRPSASAWQTKPVAQSASEVQKSPRNLKRSMEFFSKLGFEFNPQFTDDNAACMVLSDDGFVMLLGEPFFRTFTKKSVCNTATHNEALVALSCESRAEVDALVKKALANGGTPAMPPQDHGFMYGWSFYDPDGHHWEAFWMDPAHIQR